MGERIKTFGALVLYLGVISFLVGLMLSWADPISLYPPKQLDRKFIVAQVEAKFGYEFHTLTDGETLWFIEAPYCDDTYSFLPEPYHGLVRAGSFIRIECTEASP